MEPFCFFSVVFVLLDSERELLDFNRAFKGVSAILYQSPLMSDMRRPEFYSDHVRVFAHDSLVKNLKYAFVAHRTQYLPKCLNRFAVRP